MAKRTATLGQLWVRSVVPEDIETNGRVLDKRGVSELFSELAQKHPDEYAKVALALSKVGRESSQSTGGLSFGLAHLKKSLAARDRRLKFGQKFRALLDRDDLTDKQRDELIIRLTGEVRKDEPEEVFQEALAQGNPLAVQILGAGRGNKGTLASLLASDSLYVDHRGRTIPVPVMKSYAEGLSPLEYFAGSYGARKGVVDTKLAVAKGGYFGKQMVQAAHRLLVTGEDRDTESETLVGLPVEIDDEDNEGALLAAPALNYRRNTILTPKILQELKGSGVKRLLVRSPLSSGSPDGGVYARDVGVREFGRLPRRGELVGIVAGQAAGEGAAQSALSSKHSGGVAGAGGGTTGFSLLNQLIQVPKVFPHAAAHAQEDGKVTGITPAPAGGYHVQVGAKQHYIPSGHPLKVKVGQNVEAGDILSEGIPNPAEIVRHKGIGEGRKYFAYAFRQAMRDADLPAHRRNMELLSRSLINHVRLTEEIDDWGPDDVVPYSMLEHEWKPREGFKSLKPGAAVGRYLEKPYLHYSIGSKIRPSMLPTLQEFGVQSVDVHDDPPPFEPEMVRAAANLQHDPDWMTRMFGANLQRGLLKGVHRGDVADESGTSFVAGRARGVDFGRTGKVVAPLQGGNANERLSNGTE